MLRTTMPHRCQRAGRSVDIWVVVPGCNPVSSTLPQSYPRQAGVAEHDVRGADLVAMEDRSGTTEHSLDISFGDLPHQSRYCPSPPLLFRKQAGDTADASAASCQSSTTGSVIGVVFEMACIRTMFCTREYFFNWIRVHFPTL